MAELKHASKKYGALTVYDGIDLVIERGQKIALVGPNGAGKSTMMKLIAGVEKLTGGDRVIGDKVRMGYFAQDLAESLDYEKTVIQELSGSASALTTPQIRGLLGAMLFSGDDVDKRVAVLSGGERARLALAKVLAQRNNCLLLDEPTNNLDIVAKDSLLEALRRFPGTVLIVSHDRFVLNELATEVIEVGRGQAVRYLGNYDRYLEKKAALEQQSSGVTSHKDGSRSATDRDRIGSAANEHRERAGGNHRARDGADAGRRHERAAKRREQIEAEIEKKEAERASLAEQMNDPNFYLARNDADELIARYEKLGCDVERLYADLVKSEESAAG